MYRRHVYGLCTSCLGGGDIYVIYTVKLIVHCPLTSISLQVNFHVIGFSAICLATALRGLKSVLGSILLTGEDSLDALSLLYYTSQTAAGILTIAVIAVEAVPMWTDPLVLYGMWLTKFTS